MLEKQQRCRDSLSAPNPKRNAFLEVVVEVVLLPVFNVVGELKIVSRHASTVY